jgi:prolyl-tRNA editing enzyme YbaK/EbsC (Cys-tRNA(Pro) deacylase)
VPTSYNTAIIVKPQCHRKVFDMSKSRRRFERALLELGFEGSIIDLPGSTRTADEAAAAVGCTVNQIAKSLIFRGKTSGEAVLAVMSGSNRVSLSKFEAHLGESIERAEAAFVREVTGYAIGGVPPFGHKSPVRTALDADLFALGDIWAAAGGPFSVFQTTPEGLEAATRAPRVDLAE